MADDAVEIISIPEVGNMIQILAKKLKANQSN